MKASIKASNGFLLRDLAQAALVAISANQQQLNALNVFPVPDGDTGTNMVLTMRSIVADLNENAVEDVPATSEQMARAALLGARGNSGLIMAQLYRGLRDALNDAEVIDAKNFAAGISNAAKLAYAAVPNPVEGTMLTVLREAGETATEVSSNGSHLVEVVEATANQSMDTVERTPEMLEVLKEAGVVDSGGFGLSLMFMGMSQFIRGEGDGSVVISAPGIDAVDLENSSVVIDTHALEHAEEEAWGYCTSFAIEGDGFDTQVLSTAFGEIGRSTVVAGEATLVKVHVHVEDPGTALSLAHLHGVISNVSIQNMDAQASEWAEMRKADATRSAGKPDNQVAVAVVAVAVGDGLAKYFRETGMGSCLLVEGGDTLNPSVSDLLQAIEDAPSESVVVLPNNKNIVGAANQAAELSDKEVSVISTTSMQQGIAAMNAYDPDGDLADVVEEMEDMLDGLHVGSVFRATRDATISGVEVREGQFTATVDGEIVAASGDDLEMLTVGIKSVMHHGALVSVYVGEDVAPELAEIAENHLNEELGEFHRVVSHFMRGDQPHYSYLFSVE